MSGSTTSSLRGFLDIEKMEWHYGTALTSTANRNGRCGGLVIASNCRGPDVPIIQEFDIQRAYVMWFCGERWEAGPAKSTWKIQPAKRPGVIGWHTPNGGHRNAFEGKRLRQSGVLAGIPDWWMLFGRLYGIEFKKPGGVLSPVQIALHPQLIAAGAWIVTVDSLEAAKAQTIEWGLTIDR
jgi:hypothetical protein